MESETNENIMVNREQYEKGKRLGGRIAGAINEHKFLVTALTVQTVVTWLGVATIINNASVVIRVEASEPVKTECPCRPCG